MASKVTAKSLVQTADIPPLPHVLRRILDMADKPTTTGSDLEKLVSLEPALVGQLLKWVNSAYYSLPKRVSSVGHAMILLGFSTVKSIVSGMVLINAFSGLSGVRKAFVQAVWRHTLTASNYARLIGHHETMAHKEELFLAAMIHDVGYLVLGQSFGKRYDELIAREPFPSQASERELFGFDHVEIGAALLESWVFPDEVVALVSSYHTPAEHPVLAMADDLAYSNEPSTFLAAAEPPPHWAPLLEKTAWSWPALAARSPEMTESAEAVARLIAESGT